MAMVDHLVDAALYLHEAQIDGYDVDAKFLEPAHQIRNLMWSKFQHTQLAQVLQDAEKAIIKAQKARSQSQNLAALNSLVIALKPWMMEGRAAYYKARKLNIFAEKSTKNQKGRLWIQKGDKPLNPYGKKLAELVPWPNDTPKPIASNNPVKLGMANIKMSERGRHVH